MIINYECMEPNYPSRIEMISERQSVEFCIPEFPEHTHSEDTLSSIVSAGATGPTA